jgi:hypothetical protein
LYSSERSFSFDQWCEDDLLQPSAGGDPMAQHTVPHSVPRSVTQSVTQLLDEEGSMDGGAAAAAAAGAAGVIAAAAGVTAAAAATRRGGFGPSSNGHLLGQALSYDLDGVQAPLALMGSDSGAVAAAAGSGDGGAVVQGVGRVSSLAGWMTNEAYHQAVQVGHPELLLPDVRRKYKFFHGRFDSEEEGSYCSCESSYSGSQDGASSSAAAAAATPLPASGSGSSIKESRLGSTVLASASRDGGSGVLLLHPRPGSASLKFFSCSNDGGSRGGSGGGDSSRGSSTGGGAEGGRGLKRQGSQGVLVVRRGSGSVEGGVGVGLVGRGRVKARGASRLGATSATGGPVAQ